MKYTITDNSSEQISIITTENSLAIKHKVKGSLPEGFNNYTVTMLNRDEVRKLIPIAQKWLK